MVEKRKEDMMAFYLKGAHVPHRKNTVNTPACRIENVDSVTLPVVQHIGAPSTVCVKVGDIVKIGTVVAEQNGFVGSAVHASVSGTVSAVSDMLLSNGKTVPAVTIKSDLEMQLDEGITPPVVSNREELLDAIKESGIVGLGGAGFPTYVKFATDKKIEALVINGAECEPYITSDSYTMVAEQENIAYAIEMLTKYFEIDKVIIGIEKNKPAAIAAMKNIAAANPSVSVKVLPALYPQGGEKVLVYHTTGKKIGVGKLPIDVGCVVCNSTTVASIGKYLKTGIPLTEKCVTVDGGAVKGPKNVIAPIGTPIKDLIDFCGGYKSEPAKIIYGGPMMGVTVLDDTYPIIKNTNAILALSEKEAKPVTPTACIKCGACLNHCPFGINPPSIAKALKDKDADALKKCGVEACMECGCCSFVCPAKRPIVQNNKLAKQFLRDKKEAK